VKLLVSEKIKVDSYNTNGIEALYLLFLVSWLLWCCRFGDGFTLFNVVRMSVTASECPDVKTYKWRLTRSGTGCFIAVRMWHHWASKG